ncbi:unnamed protein product [Spirodela intermedia]|uniref:Uncharacterized protein n=1 Tax=Spirodela intermedia TaxID=51605 RepID=A0A7I8IVN5_SPIIN|nr:unnamed protein product [Spirodela intermedia]CAA6661692.1 unnamed protein product [Spirodela intermedia]
MASLGLGFGSAAVRGRVFATTAAGKSTGGSGEEKGLLDWILGGLQKEDQLLETDPILKKRNHLRSRPNNNNKKNGGFGGLFAKK